MIDLARQDEFSVLTLNRPEVLNALSYDVLRDILRCLDEVERSDSRCLIITGAGEKAFSAGADISELANRSVPEEYEGTLLGQRVTTRLEELRQPSIALVNGYALGGGCEISLACTFRLATPKAKFGLPEVMLGLVPGYGGTQRLARLIGVPLALEVMMSGRFIDAEEALSRGLVNRIVDEASALAQAIEYGRLFTRWSLIAQTLIREAATRGIALPLKEGLKVEAYLSSLSFRTVDGQEGIEAFKNKRKPRFVDR